MNILIISKYASSKDVGFESRTFALARKFVTYGNNLTLITSDSNHFGEYPPYKSTYNFGVIENINLIVIKTFKYFNTSSIRRVISWFDFEIKLFFLSLKKFPKPDIIIVSSLSLLTIVNGLRLKKKYQCKLIFEIRDIWPLSMTADAGFSQSNPLVRLLAYVEKLGYRKSDLVIGTMPNLGEHIFEITQNDKIKCACVPFGYDAESYLNDSTDSLSIKEKFSIPTGKFVVGYAGSIGLTNGLDAFIDAIEKMEVDKNFYFIIIGDGALKSKYVEQLVNNTNVLFISKVPKVQVQSLLLVCDLLYFSSLKSKIWQFGWSPNKLIDYMVSGKPVLASYEGYQSMINEANSGFFIPAENSAEIVDKLNEIYHMPYEYLVTLGKNGKDWIIHNRNWDTIAKDYLSIMNNLITVE